MGHQLTQVREAHHVTSAFLPDGAGQGADHTVQRGNVWLQGRSQEQQARHGIRIQAHLATRTYFASTICSSALSSFLALPCTGSLPSSGSRPPPHPFPALGRCVWLGVASSRTERGTLSSRSILHTRVLIFKRTSMCSLCCLASVSFMSTSNSSDLSPIRASPICSSGSSHGLRKAYRPSPQRVKTNPNAIYCICSQQRREHSAEEPLE